MRRSEEQLQRAVVDLLQVCPEPRSADVLSPRQGRFPDEGGSGIGRALGVRAGAPICWSGHSGGHFAIELKAGQRAVLSGAQVVWHSTLESLGHRVYSVARSMTLNAACGPKPCRRSGRW